MLREYATTNPYFDSRSTYAIAEIFGVSAQTISNWIGKYPEFAEAVDDVQKIELKRVESSLLKRILWHTTVEEKIIQTDKGIVTQITKKEMAPDPSLIRYYLNNRDPENWSEKRDEEKPTRNVTICVDHDPREFA